MGSTISGVSEVKVNHSDDQGAGSSSASDQTLQSYKDKKFRDKTPHGLLNVGVGTDYRYASGDVLKNHVDLRLDVEGALMASNPLGSGMDFWGGTLKLTTDLPALEKSQVDGVSRPRLSAVVGAKYFGRASLITGADVDVGVGIQHDFETKKTVPLLQASAGFFLPLLPFAELEARVAVTAEKNPDVSIGAGIKFIFDSEL